MKTQDKLSLYLYHFFSHILLHHCFWSKEKTIAADVLAQ